MSDNSNRKIARDINDAKDEQALIVSHFESKGCCFGKRFFSIFTRATSMILAKTKCRLF